MKLDTSLTPKDKKKNKIAPLVEREALIQAGVAITGMSNCITALCQAGQSGTLEVKELITALTKTSKSITWSLRCAQENYEVDWKKLEETDKQL